MHKKTVTMQLPEWLRDALKIEAAVQKETMAELVASACVACYDTVRDAFLKANSITEE